MTAIDYDYTSTCLTAEEEDAARDATECEAGHLAQIGAKNESFRPYRPLSNTFADVGECGGIVYRTFTDTGSRLATAAEIAQRRRNIEAAIAAQDAIARHRTARLRELVG